MVGVVGQYVAGKPIDRYRPEYGIAFGFAALSVVAHLLLAAANWLPALLAGERGRSVLQRRGVPELGRLIALSFREEHGQCDVAW